jgi:acylphosphatase
MDCLRLKRVELPEMGARRYVISGRVQGVGFRYFVEREALGIGVTGWARNLDDGSVEVQANGSVRQLDDLESRLRQGPPRADVRGFEVMEAAVTESSGFYIR